MPSRQRQDPDSAGWSLDATRTAANRAEVRARGEFDLAAVPDVHRTIARAAAGLTAPATVVVDLSGVTFIDAAMLGALVTDRRALNDRGGELALRGVSPWTRRIIDICGLRTALGL